MLCVEWEIGEGWRKGPGSGSGDLGTRSESASVWCKVRVGGSWSFVVVIFSCLE